MSTVNRVFELQPSRFAFGLQLLIFMLIGILIYSLLGLMMTIMSLLVMGIAWFYLLKQPRINRFEYLHDRQWSVGFEQNNLDIQRRSVAGIIDHYAYIVIHFSEGKDKNLVIWWDQLSHLQWKNLKILAKFE